MFCTFIFAVLLLKYCFPTGDQLQRYYTSDITVANALIDAKITQILHQPSYSQFCPKFRCHGNRRPSGENAIGTIRWPVPHKPPYRRKNLAKLSYTSRVIANFVQFSLPWQRGSVGEKCDWQHSMAHPRKPPIGAKISQKFLTQVAL